MFGLFFGFLENPFNLTPDPRFFYSNPMYQEAYESLIQVIEERGGYLVLTGETGTGKTTLLKTLISSLDETHLCIYCEYSNLSYDEFLELMCKKLGLRTEPRRREPILSDYLNEQSQQGVTPVCIIDEAQNMSVETLMRIANFTQALSTQANILQVILSGQPPLASKLQQPPLNSLNSRLYNHYQLSPIAADEVPGFIKHRLKVAGDASLNLLTHDAMQKVARYAQGKLRVINMLCSRALVSAFALSKKSITGEIIDEVVRELRKEGNASGNLLQIAPPDVRPDCQASQAVDEDPTLRDIPPWPDAPVKQRKLSVATVLTAYKAVSNRLYPIWRNFHQWLRVQSAFRTWKSGIWPRVATKIKHSNSHLRSGEFWAMLNNKIDELAQLVLRYCSIKTPVHLIRSVSLRHFKFPTTQKFKRQFSKAFRSGRIHAFLWRKQLSLNLFRLSVGPGKLALVAALAWVVVYPIMENRPEQAIASLPSAANSATPEEMVPKSSESTTTDHPAISIELAAFELQGNTAQDSIAVTLRQTDSMLRITELEQDLADTRARLQESETALAFSREALKLTQISAEKPMPLQPQETTITPAQTPHQTEQFSTSRVDTLLSRANRLMDLKLFTSPVGNNAYEIYQQVLAQDPGNTAAMQGIERITAQYIRWAENSKRASDWLNARNYYRKALIVAPSNPTAEAGLQEVLFIQGQTTDG